MKVDTEMTQCEHLSNFLRALRQQQSYIEQSTEKARKDDNGEVVGTPLHGSALADQNASQEGGTVRGPLEW